MTRAAILSLVVALSAVPLAAQRPLPSHGAPRPAPAAAATAVARVNGVAVTSDRLAAALSALIPQESFHRSVDARTMATLRQRALDSVIDEELAYQDGLRRGLKAGAVESRTAWNQTVKRYGGARAFDEALRASGVTKASVEREIARRLVVEKNYAAAVMNRCQVSEIEARRFYDEHPERFIEPERVHVHAITVTVDPSSPASAWAAAKVRAGEARAALGRGVPFGEAARTYGTDSSRETGGDMGLVHRGSLQEPFESVVKTLTPGVVSEVVESLYGYHVLQVSEVAPPQARAFAQVSATLVQDLSATRCAEQKERWFGELRAAARIERGEVAQ